MSEDKPRNAADRFEKALAESKKAKYVLRLYIAGMTTKSTQALETIRQVCDEKLKGRYTLEVIDIYQQPELAREDQILATPTLIKSLPLPLRRVIGELKNSESLLGLDVETVKPPPEQSEGGDCAEV
jgi:circadian clock protein KaiB